MESIKMGNIGGIKGISGISSDNGEDEGNIINVFSDYLKQAVDKTNELKMQSDDITSDFAAGKTDNIHEVMIAAEKSSVSMQYIMQIRSKVLDAYNEIMRMQI